MTRGTAVNGAGHSLDEPGPCDSQHDPGSKPSTQSMGLDRGAARRKNSRPGGSQDASVSNQPVLATRLLGRGPAATPSRAGSLAFNPKPGRHRNPAAASKRHLLPGANAGAS